MKQTSYVLDPGTIKHAVSKLYELPQDNTVEVVFRAAKGKSCKQRGLQHIWYGDVIESGIGGLNESNKDRLDLASKYRWALPIFIRDDDNFQDMWMRFYTAHVNDPDKLEWFVAEHVHTEKMNTSQMAEFLTRFQEHYAFDLGVNLTDPEEHGWRGLLDHEKKYYD